MITDAIKLVATAAPAPSGATLYYSHNDHLGTPQVFTDQNQSVVWQADYQPFGEVSESVNMFANNLRFAGQYFDGESGLHYNYFRDYDPQTGRYVQSDPIGLQGGLNTYVYVLNNPLLFIDPTGESTILAPRPFVPGGLRPMSTTARPSSIPRNTHIPVDPNSPPRFLEDDDCDKQYFEDKLRCGIECSDNNVSAAVCKTKAWFKWLRCKNNIPPSDKPEWPNGFQDVQDSGWWISTLESNIEEKELDSESRYTRQFECSA